MKAISVPTRDQVPTSSQEIFDGITKRLCKVPDLYATIGYDAPILKAMLEFDATMARGIFSIREREAINLVVSQANNCAYCLAAHTFLAGKLGIESEEIMGFRKGMASASKFNTAIRLAKAVAENKGEVEDTVRQAFFDAGYDEAALMELLGLITMRTFANYVYALTKIPLDFPAVPEL